MVKFYYTVIVGTQPGVYGDWTQVAPKVSEISGAIHKKFKTRAEACEAFNRAAREGTVRVVQVEPEPESDTASLSDFVAPDNCQRFRHQSRTQGTWVSQGETHERHAERPASSLRPATRLRRYFHRHRNIMSSTHASPSGLAERMGTVAVGAEHRERRSSNQESRNVPAYMYNTERPGSPSSRPVGLFTRGRADSEERWQGSERGPVGPVPSSSKADIHTTISHREASSMSTSMETRQRFDQSPGAALLQPATSSLSTPRVSRLSQVENDQGTPGNASRTHGRLPVSSPVVAQIGRADIVSEAYTPGSPVPSPRAYGDDGDKKGKKKASVQSPNARLDTFDWSEIKSNALCLRTTFQTDDHLSMPVLSRPPSACSHISLASSTESFRSEISFEVDFSAVEIPESPGRSAHVPSSPTPHPAGSASVSNLVEVEDAIPGPPAPSQECSGEEEGGDDPPLMIRPHRAFSDDSRSLGNLSDVASPLNPTHSPQVDRQCALGDYPALSSPSGPVVACTSRSTTHLLAQSTGLSPLEISASSPHRAWPLLSPLLPQPHVDLEACRSPEVIGLGLSIGGGALSSPHCHALPHRTSPRASPRILPCRPTGSVGEQSPTRDDRYPWGVPTSQDQASPSCFRAPTCDRAPSGGTRSTSSAAPSPRNVPLPSSPTLTTRSAASSGSSDQQLQAQPRHRLSPDHPFYPPLEGAGDDSDRSRAPPPLLSPSGLRFALGLPTPGLSPVQVPAVIRSPAADPRSPISQWTRIPGSVIGLSRNLFFGRPTPPRNDMRIAP